MVTSGCGVRLVFTSQDLRAYCSGGKTFTFGPIVPLGRGSNMRVHLINPSEIAFGTAVITPRWLYVLAAATPESFGDPSLVDETLSAVDPACIQSGDVVGIGIHTANALRGYKIRSE